MKKVISWIVVIIILFLILAYLLPGNFKVERTILIKAPAQTIYELVCNLHNWDVWTPWTREADTSLRSVVTGDDCQVGATRKWESKKLKNGEMTITELVQGKSVTYLLAIDNGSFKSTGTILLTQSGDSCKVRWIAEGDLGNNPVSRYFGLFMGKMLGPDFEKGLAKLKKTAEERAQWPIIERKMMQEKLVLLVKDSAGPKNYGEILGKAFGEIGQEILRNKMKQSGPPFAIYLKWDSITQNSVMDIGIPVDRPLEKPKGRIRFERIPSQEVMIAYYFGPYEKTASIYYALEKVIEESGKKVAGGPWEIYITDPMVEKDTAKWETDIIFPIR